jgi:hypothetical protein
MRPRSVNPISPSVPLLAVVAVSLVGCGSSTSHNTTSAGTGAKPSGPTRAQYITTADGICRESNLADQPLAAKREAIVAMGLSVEATAQKLVPIYQAAITKYRAFMSRMAQIPQPAADQETLKRITIAREDVVAGMVHEAQILEHFDNEAMKAATKESGEATQHLYTLEQGYGFKICGTGLKGEHKAVKAPSGLKIGEPATIGSLIIRATSFERHNSNGTEATWRATISVKNNGSQGVTPFCRIGEEYASLLDNKGRVYRTQPREVTAPHNCETIEPGLEIQGITLDFKMPADDTPATLNLWGESQYEADARAWVVGAG